MGTPSAGSEHTSGSMTQATSGSGPGSINDALGPLGDALTAAAKTAAAESSGNAKVTAAVELGWLMEELTQGWPSVTLPTGLPDEGVVDSRAQALRLSTLLGTLMLSGVSDDDEKALNTSLQAGPDGPAAVKLRPSVIVALLGADSRFPKAYLLGSGLRAMLPPLDPGGRQTLVGQDPGQIRSLVGVLDALSSDLPSHAARGVANSLLEWSKSTDADKPKLNDSQVKLWRSVVVGEKKGTELLEPEDYLDAAKQLEINFASQVVAGGVLQLVAVVAIVLFAAGVIVLSVANGHTGTEAAGASAVLAALGLTWKGIGGTVGKTIGKLEAPLWGAELDDAVTAAITLANVPTARKKRVLKPTQPPAPLRYRDRRGMALEASTAHPTSGHSAD